jgi:hypothetical protein
MRNPSPPWNYQLHRSHVSLDRHQIASRSVGQAEVESGQDLMTAEGKVEMLLTPGIFLRLDKNSTVKMISPDLTHTEVALERGRAEVEGAQQYPQNRILINLRGGQAEILKNGLYEFDADNNTVRTFDGKAVIYPDNNFQNDVKPKTHIFASRVWLPPLIGSHELSTEHIGEESDRCRNLLSLSIDFAVFTTMLCAAVRPALFPRPIPVLALSGASRRDCARSRHAEAFAQRHTSSHRATDAATHPVS